MPKISGVVIARVSEVSDPQGEGRVRIEYPWMEGKKDAPPAPIATLMSGGGRGSWFMPEVGDEVIVGFDHGDVDHPYILGFLWNGVDKPPTDGINEKVRRLQTKTGHRIDFDDNSGQEKIVVATQGDSTISMTDTPTPKVTVETPGEQKIELDDQPPGKVTVRTSGNHEISISNLPAGASAANITIKTATGNTVMLSDLPSGGIGLSCPTAMLTITALQATVNATSALTLNAPLTVVSGVLQTQALVATTVMSPTYTPGAGNTLGL